MNKIVSYLKKMKQIYVNNRFNKKRLNKTKRIAQKAYKNKEPITIFSTNCIAGEIYNLLGLRFDSPTINCSFNRRDFIKFMENLDFYIKQKPKAIIDKNKVPILLFEKNPNDAGEEIKIFFPHDTNKEIVLENWEKRKKRINNNRIFIICDDRGLTIEDIWRLNKVKSYKTIIFTSKPIDEKNVFYVKKYRKRKQVGKYNVKGLNGLYGFQSFFDYVSWLNIEK